jgi:catechol 2,3-dioxygenase-like lactoylglutathione lyase family enzyme
MALGPQEMERAEPHMLNRTAVAAHRDATQPDHPKPAQRHFPNVVGLRKALQDYRGEHIRLFDELRELITALGQRRTTMTTPLALGPLGQISRSVRSIEQSIDWYENKLGLKHLYTFGKLSFFDCGGTRLFLEESSAPASESVLYLRVPDIHVAYQQLQARGIPFAGAPHLIHRHSDGTQEWMAFFEDLEGRPLAIMCQVKPSA